MNAIQDGNMLVVREDFGSDRDYMAYVDGRLVAVVAAENGGAEVAKARCIETSTLTAGDKRMAFREMDGEGA